MRILGLKPHHDGAVALLHDNRLVYSLEGEKGSFHRYGPVGVATFAEACDLADGLPDVVAIGGWHKNLNGYESAVGSGYWGLDALDVRQGRFFGRPVTFFSSSHERSHLFSSTALSPDAPLEECVVLVWEGHFGALYHWKQYGKKIRKHEVLTQPGARYAALFGLADPTFPDEGAETRLEDAGKLMALAAYGKAAAASDATIATVDELLTCATVYPFGKRKLRNSPLYNCGLDNPVLHHAAQYLTDKLFSLFHEAARTEMPRGLPLVISGGCGLNCEWNRRWCDSGLFSSVFVSPCANDSGSAIGTIADAAYHLDEPVKIDWSVYAGSAFENDQADLTHWARRPVDVPAVAGLLARNEVVAWVQGRYEIGPRALGHRSLLASPLTEKSRTALNTIKARESYRPIAPCVLHDELDTWFENAIPDPYMLYFAHVTTDALPAITHVDGTARIQTVFPGDESTLGPLLAEFRRRTGYGVLCNTSLNFKGFGFINRLSELLTYCERRGIDHAVVNDTWYTRTAPGGR